MKKLSYLYGPWHPPVTQFPIVCSILGVFALLIGKTYEIGWLMQSAGMLWILTCISALLSVITGHLFADNLGRVAKFSILPPDGPKEETGQLHFHALLATAGLAITFFMLPGAVKLLNRETTPGLTTLFLGILAAILFGVAGHEGGEMVFKREMMPLSDFGKPEPADKPRPKLLSALSDLKKKLGQKH